ncbi:145_t:CDS:1, partial [Cetraspora pellucida]
EYFCNYLLRTGWVCGRTCRRPEGCFEHWKAKPRIPCKVCSKPTSSVPSLCRKHSGTYYVTQYFNRLRNKANADDLIRMKIDELFLELSANKTEEAGEQGLQIEALQVTSTIAPIISKESEDTGDEAPIFKPGNEVTIFQSRIITSGNIPKALIDSDSENM